MVSAYLRRGMAAGLLAGLLAGLFAFLVGEPILDRAIALEGSAHAHEGGGHAHGGGDDQEIFGRTTQKVGLFFATGLFGVTVGGVFGIGLRLLPRTSGRRQRSQAQRLPGRRHLRWARS